MIERTIVSFLIDLSGTPPPNVDFFIVVCFVTLFPMHLPLECDVRIVIFFV